MEFKNLTKYYGTQTVFNDVNLVIPNNEKVGVVGSNGAGKTTLFKLIMNKESSDSGRIIIKKDIRIDWLPQVLSDDVSNMKVNSLNYIKSGRPIEKLEKDLIYYYEKLGELKGNLDEIYNKIERTNLLLDYWNYYNAESVLAKILDGIGIDEKILSKNLNELSGGQKSKVAFAKLLYSNPEILLLDEPTNHMDKESRKYIIDYLRNYKGSVFVISHDIDFLNKVTNKTLFIDKRTKKMKLFDGNYDVFKKLETAYEDALIKEANIQKQEENKLRAIINKYATASGKKKLLANDREKKLERLLKNKIEVLDKTKKVNLKMEINQELNNIPISINNLYFKYDNSNNQIIEDLSFSIYKGEKFLVVGENGAGKSTLLKLINGILVPDSGEINIGSKVEIGYYAQELEGLDNDKTILENFSNIDISQGKIRSVLGNFLFYNDDVFKKVGVLSPGERARVALAKLSLSGANLLLLDEPTNHLDPETQNIIGEVFGNYNGSVIVVSHNPEFVKKLGIERTITLPSGKIDYYDEDIVKKYHKLNTKKISRR